MSMDKCKVCGRDLNLSDSFCPQCGFEYHILPEPVSNEIRKYEEKRINACKTLWEKHSVEIKKLQKTYDEGVYKIETLEQSFKEEKAKTRAAEQEKERYRDQADKATKELASLKDVNQRMVKDAQRMIFQIKSLEEERDRVLNELKHLKNNPPVSGGAQIRVTEKNGKYILYDEGGIVRRSNGAAIGKSGIELYDGYIFQIGEVLFKVQTPEFNIDNLIL